MDSSRKWIWLAVVVVVVIALATMQLLRANRPVHEVSNTSPPPLYTYGSIVEGNIDISAEQVLPYKLNFNKRTRIRGTFWTGEKSRRISALVLTEGNFEKWKAGTEFKVISNTGYVPRGKIEIVTDPGVYYLVLENRSKEYGGDKTVEINFTAE